MKKWIVMLATLNAVVFFLLVLTGGSERSSGASDAVADPLQFNNLDIRPEAALSAPADASEPERNTEQQEGDAQGEAANCFWVGPFADAGAAATARDRLAPTDARYQERMVRTDPLWWVHLPPAGSAEQARRRLDALQARGIESFRVADGEYEHAISLGYFRSEGNAQRLRDEYRNREINAELVALPQTAGEPWLAVGPLNLEQSDRLRADAGRGGWQVDGRECPEDDVPVDG